MPVVRNAMMLIKPSSVNVTGVGSSATINDSGSVTFATAVTLSLNGVFSSLYDNYMIVVRHVLASGDQNVNIRLRASGADAAGASDYAYQELVASSTTVAGARSLSTTLWRNGICSSTVRSGDTIYIYGPYLAQPTAKRNISISGTSSARIDDFAGTHNQSTSYDGFTIYPNSSNFSGLVTVYGLRQ